MQLVVSVINFETGESDAYDVDTFQEMANTTISMSKDVTEGVVTVHDDDLMCSLIIRLEVRDGKLMEE